MHPSGAVLREHSLAIRDGRIEAILPRAEAVQIPADEVHDLPGHALLPGLINAHGHAGMSLLRGFADDQPLARWLEDHIWPAEAAHVSESFVSSTPDSSWWMRATASGASPMSMPVTRAPR